MFLTIINIVLPVFLVVAAGATYARWLKPDLGWINRINMDVFIPALIFSVLSSSDFDVGDYLPLALGALVISLGSGLLLWPFLKWVGASAKTFLPPMMFNNTGNMGIPLLVLAFGEAALPAAVTLFITVNLLHFTFGLYFLDRNTKLLALFKVPIVLATFAGLAFSYFDWQLVQALALPIEMLGQISIPLMLFALGVRFLDVDLSDLRLGVIGALACPLSGLFIAYWLAPLLNLQGEQAAMLLVFAALPPAVLNFMLAEKYQQEPQKVASIVLAGNFASLGIIPAVLWLALL